jgi:hypothetical protein
MRVPLAILALVMLLAGHVPASAATAGELLNKCEQLEKAWIIRGTDVTIRSLPNVSTFDAGTCWGYVQSSVLAHRYWEYPQAQQLAQYTNFTKNLAIFGGLLLLFVSSPGRFSIDHILSRKP